MQIEDLLNEQLLKNIQEVQENIESSEYAFKIEQTIKKLNFTMTREEIINEVKTSKIAALYLAKNPIKQNITETVVLNELQKENNTFAKLPNGGDSSLRFTENGDLISGKKSDIKVNISKSADYIATINNKTYYFAQKYTNGVGGGQDNQFNDAVYFLECGLKNKNRDFGLGLILDGDYYKDKIKALQEKYKNEKDVIIKSVFGE